MSRPKLLALLMFSLCAPGCIPGIYVRKDPGPRDQGIRYYRPKPYLLITPVETRTTSNNSKDEVVSISTSGEFVYMQLEYLPDFSEEYSIRVTPGLGTAEVNFTLEDGWNLLGTQQDLDSQFDENLKAVAEAVRAVGELAPVRKADGPAGGPGSGPHRWVVQASNVPLGYYESVINRGPDGRKRLYGWRYVGFTPYAPCPLTICGGDTVPCDGHPASPVYGLVFEEGVMTFRPLQQLYTDTTRVAVMTNATISGSDSRGQTPVDGEYRDAPSAPMPTLNELPEPSKTEDQH